MAIATYTDLVSAITEWLARDGDATLTARVPDFITLAEAKFNRLLRVPQMEKRATTTIDTASTNPEFITLPSDFQSMRRVRLSGVEGKPLLTFLSQTQIGDYRYNNADAADQPVYFSVVGTEMELAPTPDSNYTVEMVYRANIPALSSSNATNWLLTLAPDLYLYGALLEATPYMQNDERIAVWGGAMQAALEQVNSMGMNQAFNAGPVEVRLASGATP